MSGAFFRSNPQIVDELSVVKDRAFRMNELNLSKQDKTRIIYNCIVQKHSTYHKSQLWFMGNAMIEKLEQYI